MIIALVLLTIAVFLVVDLVARTVITKVQERRIQRQRQEALDIGLRLDFSEEARSLKKVDVDNARAKILAVDDEAVVLDSFRKILVIAGYSIHTVESGKEAIGLVRKNDYDFVFTDLKMPEMDGLDVVKAVKHLRPDIDVIMITGFATIESAVDAMKYGAMDYVQKPFTADELIDFVDKSLIRRQDRIEKQIQPTAHLVTPSIGVSRSAHEFNVPAGIFIAPAHTWVNVYPNGMLIVGIDDFLQKLIGPIEGVDLPAVGSTVSRGEPLFTIRQGAHALTFSSPATGSVTTINNDVVDCPDLINRKPFEAGWVCGIEPSNLPDDVHALRIGAEATSWYEEEMDEYTRRLSAASDEEKARDAGGENDSSRDREAVRGQVAGAEDEETRWQILSAMVRARNNGGS